MRVAVKNNSPAMQGVATLTGTKWIKPGATVTIDVEDTRPLERLPFLEIQFSEAGVPIGDLPPPPASLLEKAGNPLDDGKAGGSTLVVGDIKALRAEYHKKLGKRPFPGWDAEELKRRMAKA